jgi:cyclin-dependent kinase 10
MHEAERDQQDDNQDKMLLESVSGRRLSYDMRTPFYGDCRDVDDFKKLNRVGEGTYGVV